MKTKSVCLTKESFRFLQEQSISSHLSEFNKYRLMLDLKNAQILSSDSLPLNVVTTGTSVLVTNLKKHQTFSVCIATQTDALNFGNVIKPTDLLAVALLGYSPGAIIPWEFEQGIQNLQVVSVYETTSKCARETFKAYE